MNNTFVMTVSAETTTNTMEPSKPTKGDGTSDAPYEISSAAELYWFAGLVNGDASVCNYDAENNSEGTQQKADAHAKLTANIVVNTGEVANCGGTKGDGWYDWTPIGKDKNNSYKGTFDGQGYTISGLYFNDSSTDNVGLFGYIYSGTIKNVGVTNSYFCGKDYVGGVCGCKYTSANVINCYNTGTVTGSQYVGGVCGYVYDGSEANCYNTGTVTGTDSVGGVCGYVWWNEVINCYNAGTVKGSTYVGGVYGKGTTRCIITNSYYLAESANDTGGRTSEQFHRGEIAYLLSKGNSVTVAGTTYPASVWGQDLNTADSWPALNGDEVYRYCNNGTYCYSKEQKADTHNFSNGGICPCGVGSPAELDTDGYYKIENKGNLYWFAGLVNGTLNDTDKNQSAKAKLMTDIVVNEGDVAGCNGTKGEGWFDWTPIGNKSCPYTGTFDGQGHTISGLYFNDSKTDYVGLFGYIQMPLSSDYNVFNVGVVNSYFYGNNEVGGVCGYINGGGIFNCYNASTLKSNNTVGGICGYVYRSKAFKKCYNTGNISSISSSNNYAGGICGGNNTYGSSFINCYNTGAISTAGTANAGAICGYNMGSGSQIQYCYNTGKVNGKYDTVYGGKSSSASNECICYYLAAADDGNFGKTQEQFGNGEVAYLLQGSQTEEVWGQNIDGAEPHDSMPVYGGEKVYKVCNQGKSGYSNTSGNNNHLYNGDGYCACGDFQSPKIDSNDDYYIIENKGNLYWFAGLVNGTLVGIDKNESANAKLGNDITVNSDLLKSLSEDGTVNGDVTVTDWTPIGKDSSYYKGTFSGQNYTIKGLYNNSQGNKIGLFGSVGSDANISNITIADSYFKGNNNVGGVCGYNSGTVTNCQYTGDVGGNSYVGGVCGRNEGTIENCDNPNDVFGKDETGGVCGHNSGTIKNCKNTGNVIADCNGVYSAECVIGGVCGSNSGTIENCDNNGKVSVNFSDKDNRGCYVGGVCGYDQNGTITNSHNTGDVSVNYSNDNSKDCNVGGVCGYVHGYERQATITNSYNTGNVSVIYSGSNNGACNVGGVCGLNAGTIANCFSVGEVSRATSETPILGGVCGSSSGTVNNCYYDNEKYTGEAFGSNTGTAANVKGMTTADFGTGKASYLLNYNDDAETDVWGQNINNGEEPEPYPVLGGAAVYVGYTSCDVNVGASYTNKAEYQTVRPPHDYNKNGFCTVCGAYQPADLVDNVYQIGNAGQLYWYVNSDWRYAAVLTADIDINPGVEILNENGELNSELNTSQLRTWTPCCIQNNFDGNNHTISGLYFNDENAEKVGLFSYAGKTVEISNLGITDSYFKGKNYVGGVIGYINETNNQSRRVSIINCYNEGTVEGNSKVGGICGEIDDIDKDNVFKVCRNSGKVKGNSNVGGICGYVNSSGNFEGCYNAGTVIGESDHVGGICGRSQWATLKNCYNTGSVTGDSYVGGVSGEDGTFTNCYNTGSVTGSVTNGSYIGGVCGINLRSLTNCYNKGTVTAATSDYVGGVCGYNKDNTIRNCYNTNTVTGRRYVGGVCGYNEESANLVNCYNIGSVTGNYTSDEPYVGSICGFNATNNTTIRNCYYLGTEETDSLEGTEFVTEERFHSGEIAFLLKLTQADNAWGQNLGDAQSYPELNSDQYPVYKICSEGRFSYSNNNSEQAHWTNSNGFCTVCGAYKQAELTTDRHDIDKDGRCDEVYEISNAGQLYWFAGLVNGTLKDGTPQNTAANAVLMKDIVVNEHILVDGELNSELDTNNLKVWMPIGDNKYTGKFDGQGYTISGLYFEDTQTSYVGLFGCISGEDAKVCNLNILDSYFKGNYNVGGVCGYNDYGTIQGCHNAGTVTSTAQKAYVGGVCGYNNYRGTITDCHNTGTVTTTGAEARVGGVCGENYYYGYLNIGGTLENCHNTGTVTATDGGFAGGVCGYNHSTITNCYNKGTVSGKTTVGGVSGYNWYGTIKDCYNTGSLESIYTAGGVCGDNNAGTVQDCYNTGQVTGGSSGGGVCGYNSGTISGCYSTGQVTGGSNAGSNNYSVYVGGVCGSNSGTIVNCYGKGSVTVTNAGSITELYAGVVCGKNSSGTIANCYGTGNVTVTNTGSITYSYVGGVCGMNTDGNIANCYYLAEEENADGGKTEVQFNSGEVAYLLSQGCTIGEGEATATYDGSVWGQNIDSSETSETPDAYPVLDGVKVYQINVYAGCINSPGEAGTGYSNTDAPVYAEHDITHVEFKAATCTEDGNNEYWTCSYESGVYYKDAGLTEEYEGYDVDVKIPATGHTEVSDDKGYPATCTEDGMESGTVCSVCKETLTEGTTIPATGHKDEDDDCACDNCGNIMEGAMTVSAKMELGAEIRFSPAGGLRFITVLSADKIAKLQKLGAVVELGTLIAPKDLLGEEDLTLDLDSSKYVNVKYEAIYADGAYYWYNDVVGQIAGSIVGIKESNTSFSAENGNIARDFVGRGYVKVTYGDKTVITYADYAEGDIVNNSRSLASVAKKLKDDTEKYEALDDNVKALVDNWASKLPAPESAE